jgi:uncharacterized membrane protein YsdA (DUF1294 family)
MLPNRLQFVSQDGTLMADLIPVRQHLLSLGPILKTIALVYVAYLTLMSVVTFLYYGWDKRQSRIDGWRTPETRLHWLAFLGGWPGAMIGQKFFRHKTQKSGFKILTWAAAILHFAGVALISYVLVTRT